VHQCFHSDLVMETVVIVTQRIPLAAAARGKAGGLSALVDSSACMSVRYETSTPSQTDALTFSATETALNSRRRHECRSVQDQPLLHIA
jgi:hypothetical protein